MASDSEFLPSSYDANSGQWREESIRIYTCTCVASLIMRSPILLVPGLEMGNAEVFCGFSGRFWIRGQRLTSNCNLRLRLLSLSHAKWLSEDVGVFVDDLNRLPARVVYSLNTIGCLME